MLEEKVKIFLFAVVIPAIFLLAGILACAIDYAMNKSNLDAIPPDSVQWWYLFTFDHYTTWIFVNHPAAFTGIYIGCAIGMYVAAFIVLHYAIR